VVAVGAAVLVCAAALGQSGLVTTTVAGTATAADRRPGAGANITATAGAARTTRPATAAEEVGVVDITSVLDYGSAEAAGTGVVLTPSGEILTNNHVIDGATKITATVVATGRSYAAAVVGTDPGDDVAVLRLSGAAGLPTARIADAAQVAVGDAVTASATRAARAASRPRRPATSSRSPATSPPPTRTARTPNGSPG
jgi:S1-C subfamily serine protease